MAVAMDIGPAYQKSESEPPFLLIYFLYLTYSLGVMFALRKPLQQ